MAAAHLAVEPNLEVVVLLEPLAPGNPEEPIKLLEVVRGTIERGIEPVSFAANPGLGIRHPSVIVEVSPAEFQKIKSTGVSKMRLPHGWKIGRELARRGGKNGTERPRLVQGVR